MDAHIVSDIQRLTISIKYGDSIISEILKVTITLKLLAQIMFMQICCGSGEWPANTVELNAAYQECHLEYAEGKK